MQYFVIFLSAHFALQLEAQRVLYEMKFETKRLQMERFAEEAKQLREDLRVLVVSVLLAERECNYLADSFGVPRSCPWDARTQAILEKTLAELESEKESMTPSPISEFQPTMNQPSLNQPTLNQQAGKTVEPKFIQTEDFCTEPKPAFCSPNSETVVPEESSHTFIDDEDGEWQSSVGMKLEFCFLILQLL